MRELRKRQQVRVRSKRQETRDDPRSYSVFVRVSDQVHHTAENAKTPSKATRGR
jgi:hypothetical protein